MFLGFSLFGRSGVIAGFFWEGLNCGCGRAGKEEAERERFTCFDDAESIQNFFGYWVLVRGLGF